MLPHLSPSLTLPLLLFVPVSLNLGKLSDASYRTRARGTDKPGREQKGRARAFRHCAVGVCLQPAGRRPGQVYRRHGPFSHGKLTVGELTAFVIYSSMVTAAAGSISELLVQRARDRLMDGRTTIIIAHRFSTIVKAARILVIDDRAVRQ